MRAKCSSLMLTLQGFGKAQQFIQSSPVRVVFLLLKTAVGRSYLSFEKQTIGVT